MRFFWIALAVLTVARLVVAALAPLSPDEAYYWVWSRALAGGYPDHPPMVALWIWLGTAIAGDGAFGVRLLAPVATALGSVLLVRAGDDFFPGRGAGVTAAVLLNATLLLGIGAVTMTPDTPLLLFWTALLWALGRLLVTGRGTWWLVAGAAAGLAMDSKYTALLLLPAIGAWIGLAPSQQPWLRRPWPWVALALAALLFAPVLVWNADHEWVSFAKQGARAADWNPRRGLQFVGELIGGQIGLATPLIALLFGAGMTAAAWRARTSREPTWTLLAMLSLLPVLVFVQHAVGDRVQANWPSVIYPSAAIAAAGLSAGWLRLVWPGAALGFLITLAVWVQAVAAPFPLPARWDPTLLRLGGWDGLAAAIEAERQAENAAFVAADNYGDAAMLARALPDVAVVGVDARWSLFDLPDGRATIAGRAGLLVQSARREGAPDAADWAQITQVGKIARTRDGVTAEEFYLYRVVGRAGDVPVAVMPRPR